MAASFVLLIPLVSPSSAPVTGCGGVPLSQAEHRVVAESLPVGGVLLTLQRHTLLGWLDGLLNIWRGV
jgi:hypothetical protein